MREHQQDDHDVAELIRRGLVTRSELLTYFEVIEPYLYRYPALDPESFRRRVETVAGDAYQV